MRPRGCTALILFDDVTYTYPGTDLAVPALDHVSVELSPGEVVVVLGANGSGKSTLVRLANGLLLPSSGTVSVDGIGTGERVESDVPHDEAAVAPGGIRSLVGVVFQHPDDQIVGTAVEDDVAFGPENLGLARSEIRRRVDESLAVVGLTGLERREPHLLSGGQKQRLAIAGALAMMPRYLVFDEPTSMLDPRGRAEVLAVIGRLRDAGHGIMLVTHDLAEIAGADRAVVLSAGSVVFAGTPSELLEHSSLQAWGLELPPVALLARALRRSGVPVPAGLPTPGQIAGALCR